MAVVARHLINENYSMIMGRVSGTVRSAAPRANHSSASTLSCSALSAVSLVTSVHCPPFCASCCRPWSPLPSPLSSPSSSPTLPWRRCAVMCAHVRTRCLGPALLPAHPIHQCAGLTWAALPDERRVLIPRDRFST